VAKAKQKQAARAERVQSTVAVNRRGRYDYEILDSIEAGLALQGSEVKAIREGHATIGEGYARFADGELWLYNVYIGPYGPARENHDPRRSRKLLLHRRQLERWQDALEEHPRTTIIPLRMYLHNGRIKVEIGLARGKRSYDKRESIKKREADRMMQRALRQTVRT
jgi:SsrA-binding protein